MQTTWKTQYKYSPGQIVIGKWNGERYQLIKMLGSGANGIVYLAKGSKGYVALKMSSDSLSITSEVNVLKALEKVQGTALGPYLYDVDDWETRRGKNHFYTMEYIQGPDLLTFVQNRGHAWTGIMIVQLLDVLAILHQNGWVFGDLKPENLIVSGPPPKIRCIDVGGTTKIGRAIKEFTEFFDRGYWGLGSRKAEPAYDLFSTAMMIINMYYPKRFERQSSGYKQLIKIIQATPGLKKFEPILEKALLGKYESAAKMKDELLVILSDKDVPTTRVGRNKKRKRPSKFYAFLETTSILCLTILLYILYIYGYLL